ncbi:ABC transporter ATP-binding protein [Cellvibrio sp. KY-GH-1]|uniref:ABC transporter ATP-binding protein n=1 Tax=Cellvibrio sp. KY-GH-1 TaxID=2303332 RepID=UPI0012480E83|nr:ABC transporter ATP-binding protein [Cellvibrio sp. KY-GH-1]QEY17319.1 ABC transporter ATP-binding protein [Cellvibrio sp. KY-GH-1]
MIKVSNISKTYLIWKTPLSRLLVPLAIRILRQFFPAYCEQLLRRNCQQIQALNDVSFTVREGESLGIIGLNGSGKSTLLQIIAGTLQATQGSVEVKGRIAALLELGSGFDPEFTGRENVYINAAILGLSRIEIDARYDDIVAFADIGDFIERPVKTYSSGMMVRLAFAVQVHVDPDVLIVDEALSVGDARFQAKALAKIEEILRKGTTLLFVGHDLGAVRSFCNQAMLLEKGKIIKTGIPDDVVVEYLYQVQKDKVTSLNSSMKVNRKSGGFGVSGFDLVDAAIRDHGNHAALTYGSPITLDVDLHMIESIESPYLIVDIIDNRGMHITGKRIPIADFHGFKRISVSFACCFRQGVYRIALRMVSAPSVEQTVLMCRYDDMLLIEMVDDTRDLFTGLVPTPMDVSWSDVPA